MLSLRGRDSCLNQEPEENDHVLEANPSRGRAGAGAHVVNVFAAVECTADQQLI